MAGSLKRAHCISCGAEIPSDAIEKKEAPEARLARLLEIQDFPLTHAFFFCSGKCRNNFNGEKKTRKCQAEALGKISKSPVVTRILATKIRVGTKVDVQPDLSTHR
jgi:predicted nucleic acid-binding Zn ribbon protein